MFRSNTQRSYFLTLINTNQSAFQITPFSILLRFILEQQTKGLQVRRAYVTELTNFVRSTKYYITFEDFYKTIWDFVFKNR